MKRYIIHKHGLCLLEKDSKPISDLHNCDEHETLECKHLDFAVVTLTDEEVEILTENGVYIKEEHSSNDCLLWDNTGYSYNVPNLSVYEKIRDRFIKVAKSGYTGKGVKVAVLDTGLCRETATIVDTTANINHYIADILVKGTYDSTPNTNIIGWTFPIGSNNFLINDIANPNNISIQRQITTEGALNTPVYNASGFGMRGWNSGAYTKSFITELNTVDTSNIKLDFDITSTVGTPRDMALQYRIGTGGTWTTIEVLPALTSGLTVITNKSLPSICEEQPSLFIRLTPINNTGVNGSAIGTGHYLYINRVRFYDDTQTIVNFNYASGNSILRTFAREGNANNLGNNNLLNVKTYNYNGKMFSATLVDGINAGIGSNWFNPTMSNDHYIEAIINTTGATNLTLSSKHCGQGIAPERFRVQYSVDGGLTWTFLNGGELWIKTTQFLPLNNEHGYVQQLVELPLPVECENISDLRIKWRQHNNIRVNSTWATCTTRIPAHKRIDCTKNEFTFIADAEYNHGSQMTSIIKALDYSGYISPTWGFRVGNVGMGLAPNCEMHAVKMIGIDGYALESWVLAALDYCLDNDIDFINCSWQFITPAVEAAIKACIANGSVVVAAAGNSSFETYTTAPACVEGVVAVQSLGMNGVHGHFSYLVPFWGENYHGITISCGGFNVTECLGPNGGFGHSNGTSSACANFTGILAVTKEMTELQDNHAVLKYVLDRAIKHPDALKYGLGYATF